MAQLLDWPVGMRCELVGCLPQPGCGPLVTVPSPPPECQGQAETPGSGRMKASVVGQKPSHLHPSHPAAVVKSIALGQHRCFKTSPAQARIQTLLPQLHQMGGPSPLPAESGCRQRHPGLGLEPTAPCDPGETFSTSHPQPVLLAQSMCLCVHRCACACYVSVSVSMSLSVCSVCVSVCLCVSIHTCLCLCVSGFLCMSPCLCVSVYLCVCLYACVCMSMVCVSVCVCVPVYMHACV